MPVAQSTPKNSAEPTTRFAQFPRKYQDLAHCGARGSAHCSNSIHDCSLFVPRADDLCYAFVPIGTRGQFDPMRGRAFRYSLGVKLVSWNVNGLRSALRKNFLDYLGLEQPDILCLQEIKCTADDIEPSWPVGYLAFFNPAQKRGYSGTAILTKRQPISVKLHMGVAEHDREGRVTTAEYGEFFLVNVYVPNSKRDLSRLPYRQTWDRDFLRFLRRLERRKPVVFCGDFNVAHTEIDLSYPKANVHNHGFTAEERAGFAAFVKAGFIDTFREFERSGGHYTWWSVASNARARNIGWRIDYFLISAVLRPRLKKAFIRSDVMGSDHCPVGIVFK